MHLKKKYHCVKSVQIQIFVWSIFSCIRTEYTKIWTRKTAYSDTFHTVYRSYISSLLISSAHQLFDLTNCWYCGRSNPLILLSFSLSSCQINFFKNILNIFLHADFVTAIRSFDVLLIQTKYEKIAPDWNF